MSQQTTPIVKSTKRRAPLIVSSVIIVSLFLLFLVFSGFYTEVLWFDQLGFLKVLTTQWIASGIIFVVAGLVMAISVWLSIRIAYRSRPIYAQLNSSLDRYQQAIEPLRRVAQIAIPVFLGIFAAVAASAKWQTLLPFFFRTQTGQKDPQFGLDISFYLFELPFWRNVIAFASAVVFVSGLACLITSYLYGAIRVTGTELVVAKTARIQLAIIASLYLLLQALSLWFDQYVTLSESNNLITGAGYADVNATIPGKAILSGIAVLIAVLFLITAFLGRWRLPLIGTVLLIISSILLGSLYPWIVQRFQVEPSAKSLEAPYIQRNIDLTRKAFGVDSVEEIPYDAKTTATTGALRSDAQTTANIRILDPGIVSDSFAQLQQFRQYYQFPQHLDVDRYTIDGKSSDAVVATRDLRIDGLGEGQTWVNKTLVYTHGYGLVGAYGNKRSADGQPVFFQQGIPTSGKMGAFEPRIYFGEYSPKYSIVGGKKGEKAIELDFPSGKGTNTLATQTTFTGDGGPKLDNPLVKLAYSLKFQSEQIFLANGVTDKSQILYDRDPKTRVSKVAPYLKLDNDIYPSVVDGRIVWIVDGYTTSDLHPYSKKVSFDATTGDSEQNPQGFALDEVNYVRNSVKATVDAYSGKVTLYAWDKQDPILSTWQKIFPATVKPMTDMSAELMSHVRYPQDLFRLQRAILGQYHVKDAGSFYSRDDAWTTPKDPVSPSVQQLLQPPYYLTMQMPGQNAPKFSLYSTFIPDAKGESSRNVLTGYLAVNSDAGHQKGVRDSGFGRLKMLTLPKDVTVPGPGQVQNQFNGDPKISSELNLLNKGQSKVLNGNLLTLPVGGGLLYVQPVYVKSTGETSYPLLQKILVAFGDNTAFESTLDKALDTLFGGDSGARAGDTGAAVPSDGSTPAPQNTQKPDQTPQKVVSAEVADLLNQARVLLKQKSDALAAGDLEAFGSADKKLTEVLGKLLETKTAQP